MKEKLACKIYELDQDQGLIKIKNPEHPFVDIGK